MISRSMMGGGAALKVWWRQSEVFVKEKTTREIADYFWK
jgi:hypothetical protein